MVSSPSAAADPRHTRVVQGLRQAYEQLPPGAPVRLAKRTPNLFRFGTASDRSGLDVTGLDRVLSVDPEARTADVQGMTTYEDLVDATLAYGLMPLVVPQLKTITLGGAVAVSPNVRVGVKWMSSDEVSGPPLSTDTLQFDINAKF